MNYSSRLLSNLRALFGIGRTFAACFLVAYPAIVLFLGDKVPMPVGEIYFKSPTVSVRGESDAIKNPAAKLIELRGKLSLRPVSTSHSSFHRALSLLPMMVGLGFGLLVCQWMWRLCRNVEKGEIFSANNLKLVRWLGILLVIEPLVLGVLAIWNAHLLADYARENISVGGLETTMPMAKLFAGSGSTGFDVGSIVIGLLVLCLAEVFRQGLLLKQEAELTV
jgi:hypothetical protein